MQRVIDTLTNTYNSLLVSRRGAYSVERVLAFQDYCAQTSTLRALIVCFVFPLPSLLLIIVLEAVPLEDPSLGVEGNRTFWLRTVISTAIISACCIQLGIQGIPELALTARTKLGICVVSTLTYVSVMVGVACLWRFPIPFMISVGSPALCSIFLATCVAFVGIKPLKTTPKLKEQAAAFTRLLAVLSVLGISYPTYNAVFVALDGSPIAQNACVLVLPLLRLVLRNLVANACAYWEDLVPETTIFSVEVFHSIYVAQSMQSGNSVIVAAAVVSFDFVWSLYTLHRLRQRALHIQRSYRLAELDETSSAPISSCPGLLKPLVQAAFTDSTAISFADIRVLGSFPHNVAPTSHRAELIKRICNATGPTHRFASSSSIRRTPFNVVSVVPIGIQNDRHQPNPAWIEPSLRLLFQCEYVLVAEYVECIVSAVCAVYLAVIFELPNLQYYPYQASIAVDLRSWIMLRLTMFAAIEFASLVFVVVQMQRQVGFSTLHLLAFVLETQFNVAQGKFVLWVTVLFQFTLVHLGADFPALLRWLRGS